MLNLFFTRIRKWGHCEWLSSTQKSTLEMALRQLTKHICMVPPQPGKGPVMGRNETVKTNFQKLPVAKYCKTRGIISLGETGGYVFLCVCRNYTRGPTQTIW